MIMDYPKVVRQYIKEFGMTFEQAIVQCRDDYCRFAAAELVMWNELDTESAVRDDILKDAVAWAVGAQACDRIYQRLFRDSKNQLFKELSVKYSHGDRKGCDNGLYN